MLYYITINYFYLGLLIEVYPLVCNTIWQYLYLFNNNFQTFVIYSKNYLFKNFFFLKSEIRYLINIIMMFMNSLSRFLNNLEKIFNLVTKKR